MTLEEQYKQLSEDIKTFNSIKADIDKILNRRHGEREKIKELLNGQIPLDI